MNALHGLDPAPAFAPAPAPVAAAAPATRIGRLVVPTRDCAHALEAGLPLLLETARAGRAEIVVVHDSPRAPEVDEVERATRRAADFGVELRVLAAAERRAFADALAERSGIEPRVVRFALLGEAATGAAYGAARNWLLLASAGEQFLSIDDDVGGWLAPVPHRKRGVEVRDDNPADVSFHADLGAAVEALRPSRKSLVHLHEAVLGRSVDSFAGQSSMAALQAAGNCEGLAARRIREGARVVASHTGFVGDLSTRDMLVYLTQTGASREALVTDEATFRATWSARQVIRAARRLTITDGSGCSTACTAYDAGELLPPFFPVMRGEGGTWGATLRASGAGLVAHLPWVVPHLPLGLRPSEDAFVPHGGGFAVHALLSQLIGEQTTACLAAPRARRLELLGEHIGRLAQLAPAELSACVLERRRAHDAAIEGLLGGLLDRYGSRPAYWAAHVHAYLARVRAARGTASYDVPTDLAERFGAEQGRARCRELLALHGELLCAWPRMWEAALAMRDDARAAA